MMADRYVRTLGTVEDIDGQACPVGVDYDGVTIGAYRFTLAGAAEMAALFTRAVGQAGQQWGSLTSTERSAPPPVIEPHDEGTSYCTGLPEHGDLGHPFSTGQPAQLSPGAATLIDRIEADEQGGQAVEGSPAAGGAR
jgi:hypothetical protein